MRADALVPEQLEAPDVHAGEDRDLFAGIDLDDEAAATKCKVKSTSPRASDLDWPMPASDITYGRR